MHHLDFASEYARRTDDEIRRLIKDRHNLVDEARDALDVEVQKRRSKGFQLHVQEPDEPRIHVDEDEDGNEVVVHSCELVFPKICPRCLAPADGAVVRISCNGGSSWGLIPAIDIVLGLWRYLFLRYPVPFCRACAISVRVRRWVQRLFFAGVIACTAYLAVRYKLGVWEIRTPIWLPLPGVLGGVDAVWIVEAMATGRDQDTEQMVVRRTTD